MSGTAAIERKDAVCESERTSSYFCLRMSRQLWVRDPMAVEESFLWNSLTQGE